MSSFFKKLAVLFSLSFLITSSLADLAYTQVQSPISSERLKESITEKERTEALEELSEKRKKEKEETLEKDVQIIGLEKEAGVEAVKDKNDEKLVFLEKILFSESDLLAQEFFDGIKKKYENTEVSINDIYSIVTAINNAYLLEGYIASQAYLQEQDITAGTLFVSLVESIVDEVKIVNNKTTNEKYIRRFITLDNVDNLNVNVTNQQIMEFNAHNDAKARIALEPGKVFGTSNVDIVIDEPNRYSLNAFIDNAGQSETGKTRYGSYFTVRSLTGYRDIFNVGGVFSDGSNAVYATYEIPEPWFNTRVGAGFDYSDTEIVSGTLRPLDVKGDFYGVNIFIKKPFFVQENTVTNLTFNAATKHGSSYISSFKTQDTKTDTLSLTADNTLMLGFGYMFNMLNYVQGLKIFDGQTVFEKVGYYGEAYSSLFNTLGANIKLRGQYTEGTVPSSEQFSIGGMNTVRGYKEGMLMGRDGVSANVEVQYDVKFIKTKYIDFTRLYGFFDFGNVFPGDDSNLPDNYSNMIYSTGVGLKIGIFKHFDANIVHAWPLKDHEYNDVPATAVLFIVQGRI